MLTEPYNFPSRKILHLAAILLCASLISPALADDVPENIAEEITKEITEEITKCPAQGKDKQKVTFKINTIFNETDEDTYFIHRLANWLHVDTQPITLNNEAAFFIQKCIKTQEDME